MVCDMGDRPVESGFGKSFAAMLRDSFEGSFGTV
jgi:hypothetical protein